MMRKRMTTNQLKGSLSQQEPALPTFMDHVHELKSRFFWVAICFAISSALVYPYFGQIISLLTKPLGDHDLYYLTPAGGLSFVIKICLYLGIIGALPAIVYHLYKFIAPVMPKNNARKVVVYTLLSTALAACGVLFAYYVSLPAAIHFLVNFNIDNVSAMLTVDAYFSFVMAYIIAGAILFQLPLVMLIINSIHRVSPRQLMSYQRHNIILSFILAALLSPTPDVVNQSLLAVPMVVMYQFGVVLVWFKNRKEVRAAKAVAKKHSVPQKNTMTSVVEDIPKSVLQTIPSATHMVHSAQTPATSSGKITMMPQVKRRRMDGFTKVQTIKPKQSTLLAKKSINSQKVNQPSASRPVGYATAPMPHLPSARAISRPTLVPRSAPRDLSRPVNRSTGLVFTASCRRQPSVQRPTTLSSTRLFAPKIPSRFTIEQSRVMG